MINKQKNQKKTPINGALFFNFIFFSNYTTNRDCLLLHILLLRYQELG